MKKWTITILIFTINTLLLFGQNKKINILPLGDVNPNYLDVVKLTIESFYGCEATIKNKIEFTNDILSPSKTRYDAIKILKKYNSKEITLIITEKDITCESNGHLEWGIFGYGNIPGTTCVVSTFRLKRKVTENQMIDRLKKIVIHEIGHNLGLDHCSYDHHCLMSDANGTIKQVDQEKLWLCDKCQKILKKEKFFCRIEKK